MIKRQLLLSTAGFASLFWGFACAPAFAQAGGAEGSAGQDGDQAIARAAEEGIIVTGSRIFNPNLESPVPVTSFGEAELDRASPKIFDALVTLPQFRNSPSNRGNMGLASQSGGARLNLRNFGAQRTLILLNGMRMPLSDDRGSADVGLIPDQLVKRVDVITGGASAAYGSDAVAGAVNFILDTAFRGTKVEASYGTSTYGDAGAWEFSASHGTSFAGGRGSLLLSGGYYKQKPIDSLNDNRKWMRRGTYFITNTTGTPRRQIIDCCVNYISTKSGVITSGPLAGTTFAANGAPIAYNFGTPRDATYEVGGDGEPLVPLGVVGSLKRWTAFAHLDFEFSPAANLFAQVSLGQSNPSSTFQFVKSISGNATTVFIDNPYLTPEMVAKMRAANVTSFRLERNWSDRTLSRPIAKNAQYRGLIGLRGELSQDWTYETYFQYSKSKVEGDYDGMIQWRNLYAAAEAVRDPATGNIVCGSTLRGYNLDCVPVNLMGEGNLTDAADNYIRGYDQHRELTIDEINFGLSTQKPLFRLWSDDDAILAVGYEFRSQDVKHVADPLSGAFPDFTGIRGVPVGRIDNQAFDFGGFVSYTGKVKVHEFFGELNVPVVRDKPLLDEVTVNLAVRHTEYDPSGPATTYKAGIVYDPLPGLRFRGSFSRDMRAPAFFDMFQPRSAQASARVVFPFGTILQTEYRLGNRDLKPEKATTYTVGVVVRPESIPGLVASIDYYNIKLEDGIGPAGARQDIVDACYLQNSAFACSLITVAPDRQSAILNVPIINNATQRTEGIDFEISYRFDLGPGKANLRAFTTYTPTFTNQVQGAAVVNRAGEIGNAKWLMNLNAVYQMGPATAALSVRRISSSTFNNSFVEGVDISRNKVPAMTYVDLSFEHEILEKADGFGLKAFLNIANLFNKEPPFVPFTSSSYNPTEVNVYDPVGRFFTMGIRAAF